MRRNAVCLIVPTLVVTLAGCSTFGRKQAQNDPLFVPAGIYTATPAESDYNESSYPTYGAPMLVGTDPDPALASLTGDALMVESRFHKVAKGDTLYSLARMYYGEQARWKDVYEANRATIGMDPNQIRVGQRLTIP